MYYCFETILFMERSDRNNERLNNMRKTVTLALCAVILASVFSFGGYANAALPEETGTGSTELYLYLGSPLTLADKAVKPLDSDNLSLVPVVYQNRTLVPLRAISEHFGAEVSYDAATSTAYIGYGGKTAQFPVGKSYFVFDGRTYVLDTVTQAVKGRCLVPLRAIAETVLGKYVDYSSSIVSITDEKISLASDTELTDLVKEKIGAAIKPGSLEELQALIQTNTYYYGLDGGVAVADGSVQKAAAPAENGTAQETASESGYSSTNVQVEGIDESDIVKTDGKFIYIAQYDRVTIVRADGASLTETDVVKASDNLGYSEIYINNGYLIVLGYKYDKGYSVPYSEADVKVSVEMTMPYIGSSFTYAGIYSIDETGKASLLKEVEVEGNLLSSRINSGILYLIANQYIYSTDPGEIIPYVRDSAVSGTASPLPLDSIIVFPDKSCSSYLTVTAVDLADPSAESHTEAVLGAGTNIYMSDDALYIAAYDYGSESVKTSVIKIKIDGLNFGYAASGKVDGYILNQFSMDEYEGNFRIATTTTNNTQNENALYVLDEDLNIIGAVEGLAEGERIYSVRFTGKTGYVVTYRNMDPLFVIDLSDPTNPTVVGELEIPGFSNYLHPLSDTLVMGIGYETEQMYVLDPDTEEYVVIGTRQGGLKLSLFDVSDPRNPIEMQSFILGDSGSYAEVLYNHKALMLDSKDQTFAFDASLSENQSSGTSSYFSGAVVLSWSDNGFSLNGKIPAADSSGENMYYCYGSNRLCYIGDVLYYVQGCAVRAFDLQTLTPLGKLTLN